jgi:hypothetical protein
MAEFLATDPEVRFNSRCYQIILEIVGLGRGPLRLVSTTGRLCSPVVLRSGFDSRSYQIFWEVVGLEQGPLSLVSTTEELLGRNSSGSGLEIRQYGRRDPSRWPRGTLYPQKLALTSPTRGGRPVGIVRTRTQATELVFE